MHLKLQFYLITSKSKFLMDTDVQFGMEVVGTAALDSSN